MRRRVPLIGRRTSGCRATKENASASRSSRLSQRLLTVSTLRSRTLTGRPRTADLPPVVWAALIRSAIRFTPAEASRSTSRPTMACSASIVGTVVWYQSPGPWLA